MVPPMSTTSCCSSMRSITGCGVTVSNSRGVGALESGEVTGDLDHHHLQAEAQPEARDLVLAGVVGRRRSCPRCPARRSRRG